MPVGTAENAEGPDSYCLRSTAIPKAPENLGIESHWCLTDSRWSYLRRRHPLFGRTSINYTLNQHGYRCPEFFGERISDPSLFRVAVIGGSETFGIGLPNTNVYASLLADKLEEYVGKKVAVWNLGLPNASSDYIARILNPAINSLSPHFVFLNFPEQLGYREYCTDNNEFFFCEPGNLSRRRKVNFFLNPEAARIDKAHQKLETRYQNIANYFNNYCFSEFLCSHHSINWLFSGPCPQSHGISTSSFQQDKQLQKVITQCMTSGSGAPEQLLARDYIHPGALAHERYANLIFEQFVALYGSESVH